MRLVRRDDHADRHHGDSPERCAGGGLEEIDVGGLGSFMLPLPVTSVTA
jgi:hypothetical protein